MPERVSGVEGEMAKLIDDFNWGSTALGDKSNWSISLQNQLRMMLTCRFPMLIFWGPDLLTFYNDAFRPSLGDSGKHPSSLAQPAHISWAESWSTIGPLMKDIMLGGESVWVEDQKLLLYRDGNLTDAYWTYSFSPLFDDDGKRTGILVTCSETTKSVENLQRLQESEDKFRTLISTAPVGISLFSGPDLNIELANDKILEFWGKSGEIIGRPVLEGLPEIAAQRFPRLLEQVFLTGRPYKEAGAEAKLMKDGKMTTQYFDISYTPLVDADKKVYAILDVLIDVTQNVLSARQLKKSELFARSVFYNSPVAKIVLSGNNLVVREANEKMLEILHSGVNLIGKPLLAEVSSLKETKVLLNYLEATRSGKNVVEEAECWHIACDNGLNTGYFDYTFKSLFDPNGKMDGIICTVVEVTDKMRVQQKLEESQEMLRSALNLAGLGVWVIDAQSKQLTMESPMSTWFQMDEKSPDFSSAFDRIWQPDRQRVYEAVHRAMDPASDGVFEEIYTLYIAEKEQKRIIHSRGKAVRDSFGNVSRLEGTANDVTIQQELQTALENEVALRTTELAASNEELLSMNEELEESNGHLSRSNEELAQYAYVASHDLQEPLRKIRIYSGMVEELGALAYQPALYLYKIRQSAERMSLLIKDLLAFSKLLRSDMTFVDVDLTQIAQSVWDDFELQVDEKEATLHLTDLPVLQGLPLQMNQLFYNLMGNALKFTIPGTKPLLTIWSEPVEEKNIVRLVPNPMPRTPYIAISFQDNGIGFETQYAEQIFEVFKRLHTRDVFEGSGIGLALCRRIALNHQGALYAVSESGFGATFKLLLPIIQRANGVDPSIIS